MHLWRWDILKNAGLIDIAVNDAVNARLIILATRGFKDFPADTRTWIELWVPRRRARTGALVLLVEPINSFTLGSSPQVSYLQSVAQRARMEFFASIANMQKLRKKKYETVFTNESFPILSGGLVHHFPSDGIRLRR
jgi:hypothetical protein